MEVLRSCVNTVNTLQGSATQIVHHGIFCKKTVAYRTILHALVYTVSLQAEIASSIFLLRLKHVCHFPISKIMGSLSSYE